MRQDELLRSFVEGVTEGHAPDLHLEGPVLVAKWLNPLAIRLDLDAILVRDDPPFDVESFRSRLLAALTEAGMFLVEIPGDAPLVETVGIEVAGVRGAAWSLWARDPVHGRDALRRRALADLALHEEERR
jgi:hypothetical protein